MSRIHDSELPDRVYGSADVGGAEMSQRLRIRVQEVDDDPLIHVHIGPISVSMTHRNWAAVLDAVDQAMMPNYTLVVDDGVRS